MPVNVTFSPEEKLIFIKYSGKTTFNELQLATKQATRYASSYHCHSVLVDVRDTDPSVPPVSIYDVPKLYESLGVPRNTSIAVVGPKAEPGYNDFLFYETVCRNRGFRVQLFEDMESARAWLNS